MALTYVGGATNSNANGSTASSLVVNVPAGVVDGDFMLTVGHKNPTTSATVATPTGWTVFEGPDATSGVTCFAYYRVASSEPASYTWTQTGATPSAIYGVGTFAFRGYDPTNVVGIARVDTSYTTAQTTTAPSLTSLQNAMIFTYRGASWSGTTEPTMSTTNAGTKAADWGFDGGVSGRSSAVFYSAVQPPGTYAYNVSLSANIATNSVMYNFAIYEDPPLPIGKGLTMISSSAVMGASIF